MEQTQRHPRPGKRRWSSLCSLPTQRPQEGSRALALSDGGGGDEAGAYPLGQCGCAGEICACSPITLITSMHSHSSHIRNSVTDSDTKHVLIHSETLGPILVHAHSGPTRTQRRGRAGETLTRTQRQQETEKDRETQRSDIRAESQRGKPRWGQERDPEGDRSPARL